MSIADQIQTIARREYVLLRTCAKAVDQRLEPVVSGSPGVSSALSRVREVLRNLDGLISERTEPAADRPEPSWAEPEPEAEVVQQPEPDEVEQPEADVVEQPEVEQPEADVVEQPEVEQPESEVEPAEVEHLAEELLEEEDDHHAGELADNEDLRDVQARLRAKHTLQEFNEQQT